MPDETAARDTPPEPLVEAAALREGLAPDTASALARGTALYQRSRFFEAHEVWEEAWLREQGETKSLLQGLILCAAGLHKGVVQGSSNGCVRLLVSALARLTPLGADHGGVDLAAVRAGLERALEVAHAWNGETGRAIERGDAPPITGR